jgi:hypothetical protein
MMDICPKRGSRVAGLLRLAASVFSAGCLARFPTGEVDPNARHRRVPERNSL